MRPFKKTTGVAALAVVALALASASSGAQNPAAITIGTAAFCASPQCITTATPYPSTIVVSGGPTSISEVTVGLNGIVHPHPDDVDIAVDGPGPQSVMLLSDAGGDHMLDQDMVFSDGAAVSAPDSTDITSVASPYKPSNYANNSAGCPDITSGTPADSFPGGPASPSATLAAFNTTNANGTWSLYVVDDCAGGAGSIDSGWSIVFTGPTGVVLKSFVGKVRRGVVTLRWRTASEAQVLGFNVFREAAKRVKLNRSLIRAKGAGSLGAATYSLLDKKARRGTTYTYSLQIVSLNGKRTMQGFARVRAR